uniref:KRAB domain-containing protein n=1 Tax=Salvator merianae TaxID=96440 RepID=A0A8D0CCQ3_SALMN
MISLKIGSFLVFLQVPVTFEDVTVRFTAEEWPLLDLAQKALRKEVMEENYQNLASLSKDPSLAELIYGQKTGRWKFFETSPALCFLSSGFDLISCIWSQLSMLW